MSGAWARWVFLPAGLLSASMGAFHFALPDIFGWRTKLGDVPDSMEWSLISLNAFWSAMTLLTGLLVLMIAVRGRWRESSGRWALIALGVYWLFHAAYLLVVPFPLPSSLAGLGFSFVAFAAVQAVLHLAVLLTKKNTA